MTPSQQRLEPVYTAREYVDERLVVELELLDHDRPAKIELQQAARLRPLIHLRFEEAMGAAPVHLGAIEREIGILQQLVRIRVGVGGERNADACADDDL